MGTYTYDREIPSLVQNDSAYPLCSQACLVY
jgi:hypothetical protein